MNKKLMRNLHVDLGFSFTSYVAHHVTWPLLEQLPIGTRLVFQTDDPDYNAWELNEAIQSRRTDDEPDRPLTLIYVPVPNGAAAEELNWRKAKILASFAIKKDYKKLAATKW